MSSLQDLYGRRVRLQRVPVDDIPGILPVGTVATKLVFLDEETEKELNEPFDTVSHLLERQADGTYRISRLIDAEKEEK